jgi:hypothetical protein
VHIQESIIDLSLVQLLASYNPIFSVYFDLYLLISPSAQSQYTFFCSHLLVQSISETGVQLLIEKENNNDDDDDDDNIMRLKLNLKIPSRYMT